MSPDSLRTPKRQGSLFAYIVAFGMLLMAAIGVVRRMDGHLNLLLALGGVISLLLLGRPLFRAAVSRAGEQEIICRYIPWYQANTIAMTLPLMAIGAIGVMMGCAPDSPGWVRYAGYILLAFGSVVSIFAVLTWMFNRLRITPSALDIRILRRWRHIPRECITAISPRGLTSGITGEVSRHVDLTYVAVGGPGPSDRTIGLLDTQFSIDPANLLAALQFWKGGDVNDPDLIDRIELILRGQQPPPA